MFTNPALLFSHVRSELYFQYPKTVFIHLQIWPSASCLVSLVILSKPPSTNASVQGLLFPSWHPSCLFFFCETCAATIIAPAWVIPQCVRADDTKLGTAFFTACCDSTVCPCHCGWCQGDPWKRSTYTFSSFSCPLDWLQRNGVYQNVSYGKLVMVLSKVVEIF